MNDKPTHIAHVLYAFATGGLENGVVNIINNLPTDKYRHSIICITDHDADFARRLKVDNVVIYNLHKPAGKGFAWLWRCWLLLLKLKPDICHTRNLSALEGQAAAWLARVPYRIHGEHGWDAFDIGGTNVRYQQLRKLFKPLVNRYVGLSKESITYLVEKIKVKRERITHICNGVDVTKFAPKNVAVDLPAGFGDDTHITFGTVGRLAEVKNQTFLVSAFCQLWRKYPELHAKLRLMIVGDGVLLPKLQEIVSAANAESGVWFLGQRSDISELMNVMDIFVLPSLAEGIPNTMLEAMASGLPVIATKVGGNTDLILPEHADSHIVEVNNIEQLVNAMEHYIDSREQLLTDKRLVRQHCVDNFSIEVMVNNYHRLYQGH